MAKKQLVNTETDRSVEEFLSGVKSKVRQADSRALLEIMKEITGKEPKIWGRSIVGFGKYSYKRKSGDEFEWFNVGFSPGKAHMTIYVMYDINLEEAWLRELGPHKTGKGCLYIKKLEQINLPILRKIITKSSRWSHQE